MSDDVTLFGISFIACFLGFTFEIILFLVFEVLRHLLEFDLAVNFVYLSMKIILVLVLVRKQD